MMHPDRVMICCKCGHLSAREICPKCTHSHCTRCRIGTARHNKERVTFPPCSDSLKKDVASRRSNM